MIGYYVHHQGSGHLHRASAISRELGEEVTGLSSLERPSGWGGEWLRLERDDASPGADADANGRLHWVPEQEPGLRSRMAALSGWIARERPELIVVDVSVEVAMLARLHGVPVVTVAMPGDRSDPAHSLGYDISRAIIAPWPAGASGMIRGLSPRNREKVVAVGAISRFPTAEGDPPAVEPRSVVLLGGTGGSALTAAQLDAARHDSGGWSWRVLGGSHGEWLQDPSRVIRSASVVVTHAGQNAIADVAAAKRPAIVIPERRPHDEQDATAAALADGPWPVLVRSGFPLTGWRDLLEEASALDGSSWSEWYDGRGATRAAEVIGLHLGLAYSAARATP